jgi:CHAT domain-containing protein/tetratricopeptide (TPR) repeat protein
LINIMVFRKMRPANQAVSTSRWRIALVLPLLIAVVGCTRGPAPDPQLLASESIGPPLPGPRVTVPLVAGAGALLIRIDGRDANLRSRIRDGQGRVVSEVALDFLRSAPAWHLLEQAAGDAAFVLEIEPVHATRQARITVNQLALDAITRAGRAQLNAWRRLCRGLQATRGEAAEDWAANLAALSAAQQAFARLGQEEHALWAAYFKAYFEYYPLYRYSEALAASEVLGERAERLELPVLKLLTHQLAGQIRIEGETSADEEEARVNYLIAQQEFAAALELARGIDNGFEAVWALNNSGITYYYQGAPERAVQRYATALDRAIDLRDAYLVQLIGTNMAVAHEKLGHLEEAIATLQRMLQELDPAEAPLETEHVLNLLGLYYLKLYRFPEALDVLGRAITMAQRAGRAESLGRNRLLLALAYRELGQADKSRLNLQLAIPDLEASRNGRGLRSALALSADLHRLQGAFADMRADRAQQERFLATDAYRAEWLAGRARDAEAAGASAEAVERYRESAALFATTPYREQGWLAELRACVLASETGARNGCSTSELQTAYRSLTALQASVPALEARYLWARLHALEGNSGEALENLRELIAEMQFLRLSLPGVLGAWYWEARREIFDLYMSLQLGAAGPRDEVAAKSLRALLWLRGAGATEVTEPEAETRAAESDAFAREARALLAERQQAETAEAAERAQRLIDQHLLASRPLLAVARAPLDAAEIERQWRSLPPGWSVLTYYLAPQRLYAWTADRRGLALHDLGDAAGLYAQVAEVKENLRVINYPSIDTELAGLGERLLEPLRDALGENIVFIGAGVLSDFPLEALIVDGDYLLRHHNVVNLVSGFDLVGAIGRLQEPFAPQQIFLAGNPSALDPGQPQLAGSAAELLAVQEAFPKAELVRLEGPNLTLERLNGADFGRADLVHLASHAVIDRAYPEFSYIRLSGRGEHGPEMLTPADLRGRRITAQLAVLSACSTVGLNRFEYDTRLGFVSEFLQRGASQLLASLWPIPDRATVPVMADFYREAKRAPDLAQALRATKLRAATAPGASPGHWAAFQLFSR